MTHLNRVLEYLQSIAPGGATNAQIIERLGIHPHQTVFLLTQDLRLRGLVRAERYGRAWTFFAHEAASVGTPSSAPSSMPEASAAGVLTPLQFEARARRAMSVHFGALLAPAEVPGVHKQFDFVSSDQTIVGDAKYYTLVRGAYPPPAKLSTITEYVWLLEKTGASVQFLVFGNDRAVPAMWLQKHGHHLTTVRFYFLAPDGTLERLDSPPAARTEPTRIAQ